MPPPHEAVRFLSIGRESHLARLQAALEKAASGHYDSVILEGNYGRGKSNLLRLLQVVGEGQGFRVKTLEVGNGRVYFNDPDGIYRKIEYGDAPPSHRYRWNGDKVRKFLGQVRALAEVTVLQRGYKGLVILLDELENTFYLERFPSRVKAYRFLDAVFNGSWDNFGVVHTTVVVSLTPGTLAKARSEPGGWYYSGSFIENPAHRWTPDYLPDRLSIEPLDQDQAYILASRIRSVHGRAFSWDARRYVTDGALWQLAQEWMTEGASREERKLVKNIIALLELHEQNH